MNTLLLAWSITTAQILLVDRRALRIDLFYLRGDGGTARLSESIIALADLAGGAQLGERLRCGGAGQQRQQQGGRGKQGEKGEPAPCHHTVPTRERGVKTYGT